MVKVRAGGVVTAQGTVAMAAEVVVAWEEEMRAEARMEAMMVVAQTVVGVRVVTQAAVLRVAEQEEAMMVVLRVEVRLGVVPLAAGGWAATMGVGLTAVELTEAVRVV